VYASKEAATYSKGENPMYTFKKSTFINVSQQELFDFVSNPYNDTKWRPSAVSVEWTSQDPVGVGSTQKSVDKFLGREIESTSEVTVWDPPNEFATKSVGGPIPYELSMKFSPKDDGTQLTLNGQAEIGGFFKLAEGMAGKQFEKQIDADLKSLKEHLEEG
jgi:hypothetical protein